MTKPMLLKRIGDVMLGLMPIQFLFYTNMP